MSAQQHSIRTTPAGAPVRRVWAARAWATIAALSIALSPAFSEEAVSVDAATVSPSSPSQWVFEGTAASAGPSGPEITLAPSSESGRIDYDLRVGFDGDVPKDEAGRWTVEPVGTVSRSEKARYGAGAGAFRAPDTRLTLTPVSSGIFVPGVPAGDFSLEFWLRPSRADSGEIILMWKAGRREGGSWLSQQVSCVILRNRLNFGFLNFFAAPGGKATTLSLAGRTVLVPEAWSHHLVRFDSSTGLLEYLMNGVPEAVAWATSTGKQSGTVYLPTPGASGKLELAQNYTGLIDEFRISPSYIEKPALTRYASSGGSAVSPIFDLGSTNTALLRVEPVARTPGESAVHWSFRAGDSSAGWNDAYPVWAPLTPGAPLGPAGSPPRGRYAQLRMELYPDAAGEKSPAVGPIKIWCEPDDPPPPPSRVSASSGNGRVTVRWSRVAETDVRGYVVYYGVAPGDYFGVGALEGPSPVFVPGAEAESLSLNGLSNGTLYFIAVAAYDDASPPHIGAFSREVSARPSRVTP